MGVFIRAARFIFVVGLATLFVGTNFASALPQNGGNPAPSNENATSWNSTGQPEPAAEQSLSDRVIHLVKQQAERLSPKPGGERADGLFPIVDFIVSNSGLAAGVGYRNDRLRGSRFGVETSALFSHRGYRLYEARFGAIDARRSSIGLAPADSRAASTFEGDSRTLRPGAWAVFADLRYRDYPRHLFYGPSPSARLADATDFTLSGGSYDAVFQYQLTSALGVSARAGLLDLRIGPGHDGRRPNLSDTFSATEVPGLAGGSQFVTIGAAAMLDGRSSATEPRSGAMLGVAWWRFDERNGRRFDFDRLIVDTRTYFTPFSQRGVLALRALVSTDWHARDAEVPFFLQQSLGGAEVLRGFPSYRFRGNSVASLTAEYRWRLNRHLDAGPFVSAGAVAPQLSAFSLRDAEVTAGAVFGIRYKNRPLFHIILGQSREGARLAFGAGVPF